MHTSATPPYRPLADYALIGNTHTAALVAPDGSVDWYCLPHFDSGAVFCRLLDADRGGTFRLGPDPRARSTRRYLDGTAVLQTDHETATGRLRALDFMPTPSLVHSQRGRKSPDHPQLIRRIECLSGSATVHLVFRPTFDFARQSAQLELIPGGVRAIGRDQQLSLRLLPAAAAVEIDGDTAMARIKMRAGEVLWSVLTHADGADDASADWVDDPAALLDTACRHWREWTAQCSYQGPYRQQVLASGRVLKLLTFSPTGALVAAPTTSLPERLGGVRNWDYRFCWLRDAALVLHALMSIGHEAAANDFFCWLEDLCALDGDPGCDDLQIMHRLDGGRDLPEQVLPHLSGYRNCAPVRIGNAAARQTQLDVFGHVLNAANVALKNMSPPIRPGLARVLRHMADEAAQKWRDPDHGLWEARKAPRHFVSSKLMCWVALDRAVKLAETAGLQGDIAHWRREGQAVRQLILERGYDPATGAFTQVIGEPTLDASVLLMPLVGFIDARDPRMCSTVARIQERLGSNGLIYRYRDDDGVAGDEATFAICTYWMVDNLALQGRLDEARALFDHVGRFASDLGLMSEEIDPDDGLLLGNYPQGFTHLALIHSALTLDRVARRAAA